LLSILTRFGFLRIRVFSINFQMPAHFSGISPGVRKRTVQCTRPGLIYAVIMNAGVALFWIAVDGGLVG
jgi:hypothetical protein